MCLLYWLILTSSFTGLASGRAQCSLEFGGDSLFWSSPGFSDGKSYPNKAYCMIRGSTEAPRQALFTFNHFLLEKKMNTDKGKMCVDALKFNLPGYREMTLCGKQSGVYRLPTYFFRNEFVSDSKTTKRGFNITVTANETPCHRVIDLRNRTDTTGVIRTPGFPEKFPKFTQCEWWIKAPEGKRVELEIKILNLEKSRNCLEAYVVVNRAGDVEYPNDTSEIFCGKTKDKVIQSTGNQMNVVFDGGRKQRKGLKAYYQVI